MFRLNIVIRAQKVKSKKLINFTVSKGKLANIRVKLKLNTEQDNVEATSNNISISEKLQQLAADCDTEKIIASYALVSRRIQCSRDVTAHTYVIRTPRVRRRVRRRGTL